MRSGAEDVDSVTLGCNVQDYTASDCPSDQTRDKGNLHFLCFFGNYRQPPFLSPNRGDTLLFVSQYVRKHPDSYTIHSAGLSNVSNILYDVFSYHLSSSPM